MNFFLYKITFRYVNFCYQKCCLINMIFELKLVNKFKIDKNRSVVKYIVQSLCEVLKSPARMYNVSEVRKDNALYCVFLWIQDKPPYNY